MSCLKISSWAPPLRTQVTRIGLRPFAYPSSSPTQFQLFNSFSLTSAGMIGVAPRAFRYSTSSPSGGVSLRRQKTRVKNSFGSFCWGPVMVMTGIPGRDGVRARCIMEIEEAEAMGVATEADIRRHARRLYEAAAATTPRLFDRKWWTGRLLEWAIRDEAFKVQLFRFIDVLPTLKTPSQIKRLVDEYFGQDAGLRDAPGGRSLMRWGMRALS